MRFFGGSWYQSVTNRDHGHGGHGSDPGAEFKKGIVYVGQKIVLHILGGPDLQHPRQVSLLSLLIFDTKQHEATPKTSGTPLKIIG